MELGKCPKCHAKILEYEKGYFCEKKCGFKLWKDLLGYFIDQETARKLLNGEEVFFKGLRKLDGSKVFDAYGKLEEDGHIKLRFDGQKINSKPNKAKQKEQEKKQKKQEKKKRG